MKSLLVLATALTFSACGTAMNNDTTPTVTITAPANGAIVPIINPATTADIQVTFTATNFIMEAPVGQANVAGHGHGHLFVDQATSYSAAGIPPLTATGVPAGMHTLRVELHNSDHTIVDGVTPATVMVTVQ